MAKRRALGKGLGALIPQVPKTETKEADGKLRELDISQIVPNPEQPRKVFDEEALKELAESIKNQGLLQPLVVREYEGNYQIVVGERRWRASQIAGLRSVPVLLHDTDDTKVLELALVENIHRQDLNPMEEAWAYQTMVDRLELTQEEVAQRVGKDRSTVSNTLRLLKLHDDVKKRLLDRQIEMGHARALLALDDQIGQRELCDEVISQQLNVRQVEQRVKALQTGQKKKLKPKISPFIKDAEEKLSLTLESKVAIKPGKRGGKIEIKYSSEKELQRLFDLLSNE